MKPVPTGRLVRTADGSDLILERTFRAPATDVWASVTEPHRTARWFGEWKGDAAPGATIQVQMAFEEGRPWFDMHIDACEPPVRLAVSTIDEAGHWRLELLLSETDGTTALQLVQHLDKAEDPGPLGAGWEYYLDLLVAAREGSPQPDFGDYHPAMTPYFESLRAETLEG